MFIEQNVKAGQSLGALLESVQYYLETVRLVIEKCSEEEKVLPTSIETNNKCLDFDMDNVTFKPLPPSKVKISKIIPYKKKCSKEEKVLPTSIETNNNCLHVDMDIVTFKVLTLSKVKIANIVTYEKTWLEVMDMV
jgi:hypothetical protein